jgi:hypothetical protein
LAANRKGCTNIDCWCSLFLLHAASNEAAPHGLAATALDPIRAGDYRCQLLLQDNNSVKTN